MNTITGNGGTVLNHLYLVNLFRKLQILALNFVFAFQLLRILLLELGENISSLKNQQ